MKTDTNANTISGSLVKISLIVPCYNVERYLPRCLDSLVEQTLQDIEVICINDGSPDNCIDILHEYEQRFPGKIVIIDKPNEGVWRGRRDGIAIAQGEYIGFIDSDDYVELDYCEKLYSCAKENDASIAVCGFCREDVATGMVLSTEMCDRKESFIVDKQPERLLELNGAPWNKIFKADLLKNLPDLKNPPKIFDDMMMHLLIYINAKSVSYTPYALVHYIIRGDSIMTTIKAGQVDSTYAAMLEVKEEYRKKASTGLCEFLDAAAFLHLGISLMFRISCDKNTDLGMELKKNRAFLDTNFPSWRKTEFISFSNAWKYRGVFVKLFCARMIYKMHAMPMFLGIYRWLISKGLDIKW